MATYEILKGPLVQFKWLPMSIVFLPLQLTCGNTFNLNKFKGVKTTLVGLLLGKIKNEVAKPLGLTYKEKPVTEKAWPFQNKTFIVTI